MHRGMSGWAPRRGKMKMWCDLLQIGKRGNVLLMLMDGGAGDFLDDMTVQCFAAGDLKKPSCSSNASPFSFGMFGGLLSTFASQKWWRRW